MNGCDLHWVAGFLEGEGCFGLNHPEKGRMAYPQIQITSTDLDVLEKFRDVVGFGSLSGPAPVRSEAHRETYRWSSSAVGDVIPLMNNLLPLMGSRRRARIEEVLGSVDR